MSNTERGDQLPQRPPSFVEFHQTGAMREVSPILGGAEGRNVHEMLFGRQGDPSVINGLGTPGQRPGDSLAFGNVLPRPGTLDFLNPGQVQGNLLNPFGMPEGKDKLKPVVPGDTATAGDTARPRPAHVPPEAAEPRERVHRVAHHDHAPRAYHHGDGGGHHRARHGGDGGHHGGGHHGGGGHHRGDGHHHSGRHHGGRHPHGRHYGDHGAGRRGHDAPEREHQAEPLQGTLKERAEKIMGFLRKELHLTKEQAAGVVGNFIQENAQLNPGQPGDNHNALGIAQWNGPRKRELQAFAKEHGSSATNIDTQLQFLKHELTHKESGALAALRHTTTPEQAANVFSAKFERAGNPMNANRRANARMAYNTFGNIEIAEN